MHTQLCTSTDRRASTYSSPPTHPPERCRSQGCGCLIPRCALSGTQWQESGRMHVRMGMGVGLELFKAVHVCLSRLKNQIRSPLLLSFSAFHVSCTSGSVKQACRPLLLGSIHLCNIVIGGEGAPSVPEATVLTVLSVCSHMHTPLWVLVNERGRVLLPIICCATHQKCLIVI